MYLQTMKIKCYIAKNKIKVTSDFILSEDVQCVCWTVILKCMGQK